MKRLLYIICMSLMPLLAFGQQTTHDGDSNNVVTNDSVVVSLLTCSPGELVYELYGHTALRVRELNRPGSDWVFNYGTFSFHQPHFMWRFMLGKTDYELGVVPYSLFYDSYVREGRGIDEQVLNLTPVEAKRLMDALAKNLEPRNATYRYNFFYDNCVTRALRKVEEAIDGKVVWPEVDNNKSLRDIVHEFSAPSPWNQFGQDLLLGAEADQPTDINKQEFAPVYAEKFAEKAVIEAPNGTKRPLVKHEVTLLPAQPGVMASEGYSPITPMVAFGILLALTIVISIVEHLKKKYYWQYDALLLIAQGLTGCIIAFLFFFSAHPAVGSNWLVVLFNPIPLILFPWYMKAASKNQFSWVAIVELVLLLATLVIALSGVQHFPSEVFLIMITLLLRVITYVHMCKNNVQCK